MIIKGRVFNQERFFDNKEYVIYRGCTFYCKDVEVYYTEFEECSFREPVTIRSKYVKFTNCNFAKLRWIPNDDKNKVLKKYKKFILENVHVLSPATRFTDLKTLSELQFTFPQCIIQYWREFSSNGYKNIHKYYANKETRRIFLSDVFSLHTTISDLNYEPLNTTDFKLNLKSDTKYNWENLTRDKLYLVPPKIKQ